MAINFLHAALRTTDQAVYSQTAEVRCKPGASLEFRFLVINFSHSIKKSAKASYNTKFTAIYKQY